MSGMHTNSNIGINIHWALENLLKRDKIPTGDKNNVNLTYTLPDGDAAAPGTLEVHLSCLKVQPESILLSGDGKSFSFILDPEDPNKLNSPPQQYEPLTVNYLLLVP